MGYPDGLHVFHLLFAHSLLCIEGVRFWTGEGPGRSGSKKFSAGFRIIDVQFYTERAEVKRLAIHVVLYQPLIPANTGNISRTCAGTGAFLHLIRPLGFSTDDKMLKRAGLDYWPHVKLRYHDSLEQFFAETAGGEYYFIETYGEKPYSDFDFSDPAKEYYFVFGKETTGLPKDLLRKNKERILRIPINRHIRSLNLSNTAAIIVYEALRQQGFPDLDIRYVGNVEL